MTTKPSALAPSLPSRPAESAHSPAAFGTDEGLRDRAPSIREDAALSLGTVPQPAAPDSRSLEAIHQAPNRWQTEAHLHSFLNFCDEQQITDISFMTDTQIYGKRDGKYRQVTDTRLNSTDMSTLFNMLWRGGNLKAGEYARTHYNMFEADGKSRRYRVTITRTAGRTEGLSFTFRAMPRTPATHIELGLEPELVEAYANIKYGSAIIAGKNESGKSWFQAAIMRIWADNPGCAEKTIHVGAPIEFLFDLLPRGGLIVQMEIPGSIASYDLAMVAGKSMTPNRFVFEEITGREAMVGFIDVAVTGLGAYGSMHLSKIADLPDAMDQYFPNIDERNSRARALIATLQVITVQRLEEAIDKDGRPAGRVGIREYLILSDNIRERLLRTDIKEWRKALSDLVYDGTVQSRSMEAHARQLYHEGRISQTTFSKIQQGIS